MAVTYSLADLLYYRDFFCHHAATELKYKKRKNGVPVRLGRADEERQVEGKALVFYLRL